MGQSSDKELIQRYQAGDQEAFRRLVEQHVAALRRRLLHRLPGHVAKRFSVSDLIQETCLVAHERRNDFEYGGPTSFRNWLYGIAEHKLREALRAHGQAAKRSALREVTRSKRPDTGRFAAPGASPSSVAASSEAEGAIREAITSLSEDHARILHLAFHEGLNLREASEVMGRTHEATRKLYGRALCQLRDRLAGAGEPRERE